MQKSINDFHDLTVSQRTVLECMNTEPLLTPSQCIALVEKQVTALLARTTL